MVASIKDTQNVFNATSKEDQAAFRRVIEQPAGDKGRTIIWVIVLAILAAVTFVFGWLGYQRMEADKDGAVLFALATTALGAVVGLLAPSPAK